jgi:hypothetical protein
VHVRGSRVAAGAGVVFGLLLAAGLALEVAAGFPPTGDSASAIMRYFSANQASFRLYLWTALATIPFQVLFFSGLFVFTSRSEAPHIWRIGGIVFAGIGNAATFGVNLVWGALTSVAPASSDPHLVLALWSLYHVGGFTLTLFSAMVLATFGAAVLPIGGPWKAIGWMGVGGGAYSALVWIALCFSGGQPSPFSGLSYLLFIAWVLAASIALFVSGMRSESDRGSRAT